MNSLKQAIDSMPGKVPAAAAACGVSVRAVYKWLESGRLPRTEYTYETSYAKKLAALSNGALSAEQLLSFGFPEREEDPFYKPKSENSHGQAA